MRDSYDDSTNAGRYVFDASDVPMHDVESALDARGLTRADFKRLKLVAAHSRGDARRAAQGVLDAIYAEAMPVGGNA